jgi:hypothetical protein
LECILNDNTQPFINSTMIKLDYVQNHSISNYYPKHERVLIGRVMTESYLQYWQLQIFRHK